MKQGDVVVGVVSTAPKKLRGVKLYHHPRLLSTTRTNAMVAGHALVLEHKVGEPGRFVDGLTETWSVIRILGRRSIGALVGAAEEELLWAPTREEALARAAAKLEAAP